MGGKGDWAYLRLTDPDTVPSIGPSIVSLIFALYANSGWNAAAYLAGEVTDPAHTIPRTMIGGTLFVALLYLILNGFNFYALPVMDLLCLSIAGVVSAMVWARTPRVLRDGLRRGDSCLLLGNRRTEWNPIECHRAAEPMGVGPDPFGELRATGDLQQHRAHDFQRPRSGSGTAPALARAQSFPSLSHAALSIYAGILRPYVDHDRRERFR